MDGEHPAPTARVARYHPVVRTRLGRAATCRITRGPDRRVSLTDGTLRSGNGVRLRSLAACCSNEGNAEHQAGFVLHGRLCSQSSFALGGQSVGRQYAARNLLGGRLQSDSAMSTFIRNFAIAFLVLGSVPALCSAQVPLPTPTDSSALGRLLTDAARVNSQIPDRLRAYRARIETEMSVVVLDSGGRERSTQIEQIASDVRWRAPDRYDQRVIGYRSQSIGPTFSLMSFFGGWTVPTLYGNQLRLGVVAASDPNRVVNTTRQNLAVHPLA